CKFVRNKRPKVPLFRSSLTQSAVSAGPTMQAQMKLTQLNVKNSWPPDAGLDPKSVTNQRENPATNNAINDVNTRTRKLLRFLAATRSSRPANDRNCIEEIITRDDGSVKCETCRCKGLPLSLPS